MYCVIYLGNDRRVKVYEKGGFQQERNICPNSEKPNKLDWYLANDEDWPELSEILLKFSTLLFNAHNNAKILKESE